MKSMNQTIVIALLTGLLLFGFAPMVGAENDKTMSTKERIQKLEQLNTEDANMLSTEERVKKLKALRAEKAKADDDTTMSTEEQLDHPTGVADDEAMSIEERIQDLEKMLGDLQAHEEAEHGIQFAPKGKDKQREVAIQKIGGGGLVYTRPGYSNPRAVLGGYMALEYVNLEAPTNVRRLPGSSFDLPRYVPFIYSDVTDRTRVAAELEVTNGVGEVQLEFAVIDHSFAEWFNLRAGIILLPVGKFNLLHDDPINDLTQRPEIAFRLVPSALREPGVGFFGTLYPSALSKIDYEFYVTQGMNAFAKDGTPRITNADGLFRSRWHSTDIGSNLDNNNGKAVVGRVAYSPLLGVEVGASGYHAKVDAESNRPLTLAALDWHFQRGPWEFLGEAIHAWAEDNDKDLLGQFVGNPERMFGWYGQFNYHFMPRFVQDFAPKYFTDDSTFTGVLRVDDVNTNLDQVGHEGDTFRLSPGINFRPTEDTVFKFEYQFNFEPHRIDSRKVDNNGVLLSIATYF